jgi:SAM-dependent methyltransferase
VAHVRHHGFERSLDLGCGDGRFCRLLQGQGIATVGVDPTVAIIEQARRLDPAGDYRAGRAEARELPDTSVDLVVSYLSLIDMPDLPAAIEDDELVECHAICLGVSKDLQHHNEQPWCLVRFNELVASVEDDRPAWEYCVSYRANPRLRPAPGDKGETGRTCDKADKWFRATFHFTSQQFQHGSA